MKQKKLLFILAMAIFGTCGLVVKFIPYSSAFIACVRGFIGTIILVLVVLFKKQKVDFTQIKKNLLLLLISGALIGFNWFILFEAYRETSISVAVTCYYIAPILVLFLSPFILKEKLVLKKVVCAVFAICGMIFVCGILESGLSGIKGALLAMLAACMYAAVIILNKFIINIDPLIKTIVQIGVASIVLVPYVLLTEDLSLITFDLKGVIFLLIAGVINTGLGYLLYFSSIYDIPTQSVAIFSYVDPTVAVLTSAIFLSEELTILEIIGVILVIGSSVISEITFKKKK